MTSIDHGSLTPADGNESTIKEYSGSGTFILAIDLTNLAAGDLITLRAYDKVVHGGSYVLVYETDFQHAQAEKAKYSTPLLVGTAVKYTLQQSAGTYRAFPWELRQA